MSMNGGKRPISRRKLLEVSSLAVLGLAGCIEVETNPRGGGEPTTTTRTSSGIDITFEDTPEDTPTPTEEFTIETIEEECTNAYISNFDWQSNFDSEDEFHATVINQGDIAGEIVVQLTFYQSEDEEIQTGTTRRSVSIGAQETRDIVINANQPTDDSNWAVMQVSQQACVLDT